MENKENILDELTNFEKRKPKEIPQILDEYLVKIAKTGDTVFPWTKLKPLFMFKLERVIVEFHETCPTDELTPCPNVEQFKFDAMKEKLLEAIDNFSSSAPFTIQRLCELITSPRKHYKHTEKFMRGLEKNVLVVSTVEPGCSHIYACDCSRKRSDHQNTALMNGIVDTPTAQNGVDSDTEVFEENDAQPPAEQTEVDKDISDKNASHAKEQSAEAEMKVVDTNGIEESMETSSGDVEVATPEPLIEGGGVSTHADTEMAGGDNNNEPFPPVPDLCPTCPSVSSDPPLHSRRQFLERSTCNSDNTVSSSTHALVPTSTTVVNSETAPNEANTDTALANMPTDASEVSSDTREVAIDSEASIDTREAAIDTGDASIDSGGASSEASSDVSEASSDISENSSEGSEVTSDPGKIKAAPNNSENTSAPLVDNTEKPTTKTEDLEEELENRIDSSSSEEVSSGGGVVVCGEPIVDVILPKDVENRITEDAGPETTGSDAIATITGSSEITDVAIEDSLLDDNRGNDTSEQPSSSSVPDGNIPIPSTVAEEVTMVLATPSETSVVDVLSKDDLIELRPLQDDVVNEESTPTVSQPESTETTLPSSLATSSLPSCLESALPSTVAPSSLLPSSLSPNNVSPNQEDDETQHAPDNGDLPSESCGDVGTSDGAHVEESEPMEVD